ncbi:Hypothetical predicted protein [Paramuricea clavata]|uniref:Uncharacterized protein n=1 Tax=Paramuricea clavata TaxID=317549 RepID=A0A6S7JX39_PARCT|nr:Hypothetical predicted protein [Paramuricea clavata]
MNEITELIKDISNVQQVQSAYCEFEEASRKFFLAHKNYHSKLTDEDDLAESIAYYEAEQQKEELELETKIAQAAAEERTYSEIGATENANNENEEHSRHNLDVPKQLSSNQQVLSTPIKLNPHAAQQQQHTLALTLPTPTVPTFSGNPIDFHTFIQAFEQLIEQKTGNDSARLFYLIQYTSGDVQELMRSSLSINPREGYQEARRLLKLRYGRSYQIATAYVERINSYPQIKSEDGASLQRFSTKWRDVADDITDVRQREITVEDIEVFVEKRARASNHPIFGKISKETRSEKPAGKKERFPNGSSFFTNGNDGQSPRPKLKCPSCKGEHWLSRCEDFKIKPVKERFKLVRSLRLCDNCLTSGHVARSFEKASFCKIEGCKYKHSTFLHRKTRNVTTDDKSKSNQQENDKTATEQKPKNEEKNVQNGYVNVDEERRATRSVTSMLVLPVRVKAKDSNRTVETYAFLDGGSNTSFVTESLLKMFGAKGYQTTLSLRTMEKRKK